MGLHGFSKSSMNSPKVHQRKNAYHSNPRFGIRLRETFAVKSMQDNSNLLRLKLDMVYRDLPTETAQQKFTELTAPPPLPPPSEPVAAQPPAVPKPKRKKLVKGK